MAVCSCSTQTQIRLMTVARFGIWIRCSTLADTVHVIFVEEHVGGKCPLAIHLHDASMNTTQQLENEVLQSPSGKNQTVYRLSWAPWSSGSTASELLVRRSNVSRGPSPDCNPGCRKSVGSVADDGVSQENRPCRVSVDTRVDAPLECARSGVGNSSAMSLPSKGSAAWLPLR